MRRFLSQETTIAGLFISISVLLNVLPFFLKIASIPDGRTYIPVHNSLSDYPFYTMIIEQGMRGSTLVYNRFAVEPHAGSTLHYLYLVMGRIGAFVGATDANTVYHGARIILGVVWGVALSIFLRTLLKSRTERLVALFFALFSSSVPALRFAENGVTVAWYMTWWSELDPTQRMTFLPHYLVGHVLLVLSLVVWSKLQKQPSVFLGLIFVLLSWLAGFVHPPSLLLLLMVSPVWAVLKRDVRMLVVTLGLLAVATTSIALLQQAVSRFPWVLSRESEQLSFAISIQEYLMALGPVVLLGMIGAIVRRKHAVTWLLLMWVVVPIVFIPFMGMLPYHESAFVRSMAFSNIRLLQVVPWVPLAILSSYAFSFFSRRLGRVGYGITLGAVVLMTFVGYPATLSGQVQKVYGSYDFSYPHVSWASALSAIETYTHQNDVVLSMPLAGQFIPSYTGRIAYTGNERYYTPDVDTKMGNAWKFYHGDLSACDAYSLLKRHNITVVFYGWDEINIGRGPSLYPFVTLVRQYGDTSLYTFTDVAPSGCNVPEIMGSEQS